MATRPRGRRPAQLDPAVIAAERAAGASIADLATAHRTSKPRITAALEAAGGDPRPPRESRRPPSPNRRDDIDDSALAAGYRAGASIADLAARHQAGETTIRTRLRGAAVTLRPRGRPPRQTPPASRPSDPVGPPRSNPP
jgi:hypothetical protein